MNLKNLVGKTFGKLTVESLTDKRINTHAVWRCICDCGNVVERSSTDLVHNNANSCGCGYKIEYHGKTGIPEYAVWSDMKARCSKSTHKAYANYGGRGIKVCERWGKFSIFLADMGRRPSDAHSIDRIDNNKGYSAENCRWALIKEQANNKRNTVILEHNGVRLHVTELAKRANLSDRLVRMRLWRGWPIDRALTTPKGNYTC